MFHLKKKKSNDYIKILMDDLADIKQSKKKE
jgi:hypothetical protein